jgi:hypothetical protein
MRKLEYVDGLMKDIGPRVPKRFRMRLARPVESMRLLLAEHYGQKAKRLRRAAQGYVDDKLRELFPPPRSKAPAAVSELLLRHHEGLVRRMVRWSGLEEEAVDEILKKLETRAAALKLSYAKGRSMEKIMDSVALVISLAIEYATTGRFAG